MHAIDRKRRRWGFASKAFLACATGALALGLAAPADANSYTRSCTARILVAPQDGGESAASREYRGVGVNNMSPNRARERARGAIEVCAERHWAARDTDDPPRTCLGYGGVQYIQSYPLGNMMEGITELACDANPGRDRLRVDISVMVDGDTGCIPPPNQWSFEVARNVEIRCVAAATIAPMPQMERVAPQGPRTIEPQPELRRAGEMNFLPGIRLPGNDLRTDWIGDDGWQRCEEMCLDTPGCNAWTWRRPGAGGAGSEAACLLKSRALVRVPDPCCHSGIRE